jgi:hypothetical protein
LQQSLVTIDSPCGSNCSYITPVTGPVFNCTVYNSSDVSLFHLFEPIGGNDTAQSICAQANQVCPYPIYLGAENSTTAEGLYQFDLQFIYSPYVDQDSDIKTATVISCTAYEGIYTVAANFFDSIGTLEILHSETSTLLNPSLLQSLTMPSTPDGRPLWDTHSLSTYGQINSLSIATALGNALSGNLTTSYYSNTTTPTANGQTMILDSALNTGSQNGSFAPSIDPRIVEGMLQNLTVSVMSFGQWNNSVAVSQIETRICYSFSKRAQLVAPYAASLALSLVLAVLGFLALVQNGVPASNGAVQIMTVSAGSKTLRRETLVGSRGGAESVSEELKSLRVRFGELVDTESGEARIGFGTEDEIVTMKDEIVTMKDEIVTMKDEIVTMKDENFVSLRRRRKGNNVEMVGLKGNAHETVGVVERLSISH